MWLINADNGDFMILVKEKEEITTFLDRNEYRQFSIQYVPVWTPPTESEKAEKKVYEELTPLSRVKEED